MITEIGLHELQDRIRSKIITPPDNLNYDELTCWLLGYSACQNNDVEIIDEILGGQNEN